MKKNGKKYRKIQKEKIQKRGNNQKQFQICQEVDDINTAYLSMSHVLINNPIMNDSKNVKNEYLRKLNSYVKVGGWNRRKYEKAQLNAYKKIILEAESDKEVHDIDFYQYYILLDFLYIMAYELKPSDMDKIKLVKELYYSDFAASDHSVVGKLFKAVDSKKQMKQLLKFSGLEKERDYITLIYRNLLFKNENPLGVMVTATMSAGKSTFINSLIGKYVCLSQNMACTSKIHCIVNKTFEDGFSSEYDHDLILTAGKEELLNDNDLNSSDKIVVGTHFTGGLEEQRIILNDSPGVNFSGNAEHREITDRLIKGKNYNLLIYVMNATQLSTNDESEHLDYVKKTVGNTQILFVINKVDAFDTEVESVEESIERQRKILIQKGFKNPVICPVSAKAGYLAKQFGNVKLSRPDERELYNYIDKFEQMNLSTYYAKAFKNIKIADVACEEKQLLKTCGLAYVEKIIIAMCKGGNKSGSSIR